MIRTSDAIPSLESIDQNWFDRHREEKYGRLPKGGLRQVVPHRWVSRTTCLERFLVYYPDLLKLYAEGVEKQMPVRDIRVVSLVSCTACCIVSL